MERTARHVRPTASCTPYAVWAFSLTLGLALCFGVAVAFADSANAPNDSLTAIDVLLLPGPTMIEHAKSDNARLRKNYPQGFALDAEHHPHVTLLQRYVRTADLDKVYAAVERVFNEQEPAGWELEATGYYYLDFNNMGLAGIVIRPTPQLRALQDAVVAAVQPFTEPNGTSAAYVTTPQSPKVNQPTLDYVNAFVPQRIGKNFNPHVTIGVGQLDFVQQMKAAPFKTFKFKVDGAAVYHLGNFGTAAKQLWKWRPEDSDRVSSAASPRAADLLRPQCNVASLASFDNDGSLGFEMSIYTRFVKDDCQVLFPFEQDVP